MTRYVGIIGYPLRHTLSPAFQQAAFDSYKLDMRYLVWETRPEQLAAVISGLRLPDKAGANITVPYKESVLDLVDSVDPTAANIGAVNTIVRRGNELVGYNTDASGFVRSLTELFDVRGRRAVVLGAGGAARAICFGLLKLDAVSIVVVNRTSTRAHELVRTLFRWRSEMSRRTELLVADWGSNEMSIHLRRSHLIVNCTVVGMAHGPAEAQSPVPAEDIPAGALVYDLVYNPPETPLLKAAARAGARGVNGLAMLVYQGAASFELWTGEKAPVEIMMAAAREALNRLV